MTSAIKGMFDRRQGSAPVAPTSTPEGASCLTCCEVAMSWSVSDQLLLSGCESMHVLLTHMIPWYSAFGDLKLEWCAT